VSMRLISVVCRSGVPLPAGFRSLRSIPAITRGELDRAGGPLKEVPLVSTDPARLPFQSRAASTAFQAVVLSKACGNPVRSGFGENAGGQGLG
jgi:hypothetical protein